MKRAKGWVYKRYIGQSPKGEQFTNHIYVEEIPPAAVRAEAVVEDVVCMGFHVAMVNVPKHLIGKKVTCIVFVEEV